MSRRKQSNPQHVDEPPSLLATSIASAIQTNIVACSNGTGNLPHSNNSHQSTTAEQEVAARASGAVSPRCNEVNNPAPSSRTSPSMMSSSLEKDPSNLMKMSKIAAEDGIGASEGPRAVSEGDTKKQHGKSTYNIV